MLMSARTFATLDSMLADLEKSAAATRYATQAVANAVKQTIEDDADPYVAASALVDGIVTILHTRITQCSREDVANELMVLFYKRLDALDGRGGPDLLDERH